jgi:peptidoglycan/LPS O-acetylase OafA/YrhL
MWLVIVVSLALLTPWGIAHRQSLQPKFALVAIVFGTLSSAAFLVNGVITVFSRSGGWRAAVLPFCFAISCLLLTITFLWAGANPAAQNITLAGAALFMIAAAVLQHRARERSDSL